MTMTEVASAMGVSKDTVRNCVRRIMPGKMKERRTTYFSEEEVACISKELKSNKDVLAKLSEETVSSVKNTTTEVELVVNYKKATEALVGFLEQKNKLLEMENAEYKVQLGESKEYYTVKRMEALNPGMKFNWRALKARSNELGVKMKDVFDANYGSVKAYHISVWEDLFFDGINY